MSARRGFTLLEMLVVVAIIGIATALLSLNTRPDPRQALDREARRVALLLSIAADESRMRQQDIVWEAGLQGYRFVAEANGERSVLAQDDLLRERAWDEPLTRLAVTDLESGVSQVRLSRDAPALRVPAAREWIRPRWRLELDNGLAAVRIDFDAQGKVETAP